MREYFSCVWIKYLRYLSERRDRVSECSPGTLSDLPLSSPLQSSIGHRDPRSVRSVSSLEKPSDCCCANYLSRILGWFEEPEGGGGGWQKLGPN